MYMRWFGIAAISVFGLSTSSAQTRPAAPRLTDMERAVEEFKVQTQNLGLRADSPNASKSKAKTAAAKWHGRIFENLRNDILDAVPHEIRQRGSNKSLLRLNQFGFNLAGPLIVPKVFDSSRTTFFSVSYEGMRERISRAFLRTVPILPERIGD